MDSKTLKHLNEIFADKLGQRIDVGEFSGQSIFQYKRAHELMLPYNAGRQTVQIPGSALFAVQETFEWRNQFDPKDDRWCIAKWEAPIPLEDWTKKYGSGLGWPKHGYWFMFQPLEAGKEPTEDWTQWAADHIDWQRTISITEHIQRIQEHYGKTERQYKTDIRDMTRQAFVNHVPGARGGSYLAFSEKGVA